MLHLNLSNRNLTSKHNKGSVEHLPDPRDTGAQKIYKHDLVRGLSQIIFPTVSVIMTLRGGGGGGVGSLRA